MITFEEFFKEVKLFLFDILNEPLSKNISDKLLGCGFTRDKLIKVLLKNGVIKRTEKIIMPKKDSNDSVKYSVKYKLVRKQFGLKIKKIYIAYFDIDDTNCNVNECDGGATSCSSVASSGSLGYVTKLGYEPIKRKIKNMQENRELKKSIFLNEKQIKHIKNQLNR